MDGHYTVFRDCRGSFRDSRAGNSVCRQRWRSLENFRRRRSSYLLQVKRKRKDKLFIYYTILYSIWYHTLLLQYGSESVREKHFLGHDCGYDSNVDRTSRYSSRHGAAISVGAQRNRRQTVSPSVRSLSGRSIICDKIPPTDFIFAILLSWMNYVANYRIV